jgi:hypothetical protein
MPEYERQCQRHGGGRQLTKLVKNVTRILIMLGLEPNTVSGVAAISILDLDESSSFVSCVTEPNTAVSGGGSFSYVAMAFFCGLMIGLLVVLYKTYNRARVAIESYRNLYIQVCALEASHRRLQDLCEGLRDQHFTDISILDDLVNKHVEEINVLQGQMAGLNESMRRLRETHNELQGEIEMVSDSAEQVHFGLVELGGFTPVRSLEANDRRHMFELERANLVARRVMGADRYLATVRQQNQGTARGDDTDMNQSETAESEPMERDETVEPEGDLMQIVHTLRTELNECLARQDFPMAARFQQCVLLILDATNGQIPMSRETRANLYTELARNLEGMADQVRTQLPNVAARYNQYGGQLLGAINNG